MQNFHTILEHYPTIKTYSLSIDISLGWTNQASHRLMTQSLFNWFASSNPCTFMIYPQPHFIPMGTDSKYYIHFIQYAFGSLLKTHMRRRCSICFDHGAPRTHTKRLLWLWLCIVGALPLSTSIETTSIPVASICTPWQNGKGIEKMVRFLCLILCMPVKYFSLLI